MLWPVVAACAVYANALLWGVFQFDDYNVIVAEPAVHSWSAWWSNLGHGIRPLLKLTYTADWVAGWGAPGFHATNLTIHAANSVLVWQLTRRLAARHARLQPWGREIALATALLFAVHPVHTEAVTYISGRSSTLATLCCLAAMLAYLAGRDAQESQAPGEHRRGIVLLGLIVPVLYVASVAVKETALVLPVALLMLERVRAPTDARPPPWPVWLAGAVMLAFFVIDGHYAAQMGRSLAVNAGAGTLATQAHGFLYLLGQWAWPLHLNIDPDLPRFDRMAPALGQVVLLAAALVRAAYWLFRPGSPGRRPWLDFALAWAVLHLATPYLLLPRLDVANERQLYLASWPLLMACVAESTVFLRDRHFTVVMAMLMLMAGFLTIERNRHYYSEIALWEATVRLSPHKSRVHNNLGYAYWLAGRHAEARQHYARALQLDRDNYRAHFNLRGAQ